MSTNNYSWNQTLKFSWGHIIAFIALIFISYVAYMGEFYANGGDFQSAAVKVFIIDISLFIVFIGAQILKGADSHFNRSIILERILICLCPVVFVWTMLPYNHFWNVFAERKMIETLFTNSIDKSKEMFVDYERYANNRILQYEQHLNGVIANKKEDKETYLKSGFTGTNDVIEKGNYIHTLHLQLLSQNTDNLKRSALTWIEGASQGAIVWNAFLVGNLERITEAIESWKKELQQVSEDTMSNEAFNTSPAPVFENSQNAYEEAIDGLKKLRMIYTTSNGITLNSILSGLILLIMLLIPYLLQKRNTRANGLYHLIPSTHKTHKKQKSHKHVPSDENTSITSPERNSNENDIYSGTF